MKHSNALLATICVSAFTLTGCANKPSALDTYTTNLVSRSSAIGSGIDAEAESARDLVTEPLSKAMQTQSLPAHLEQQLRSESVSERIAACEQLGHLAESDDVDLAAIEMLADVLQSDTSMDVRMAATNALGALNGDRERDELANMIPAEELPETPADRVSFLNRIFR